VKARKLCGVYLIHNRIDGLNYVGSTTDIASRWSKHRTMLAKCIHKNRLLQRAYDAYGLDAFEFSILELVPLECKSLLEREKYWTAEYHSTNRQHGYNLEKRPRMVRRGRIFMEGRVR